VKTILTQEANKMKILQKIVAGAALTSALLFGYNAKAQNVLVPTQVKTETSAISNKDVAGVPYQRVEFGNDKWSFKYDINSKLKPNETPVNVGMFALNKLYKKNNTSIGAEIFQVGKFTSTDVWFVDAWVASKLGDFSVMLDYGKGFQIDKRSKDYVIATAKSKRVSLEGCVYPQGSLLEKGIEWKKYGFVSYKGDDVYASIGNKIDAGYISAGYYGSPDFGTFAFGTFDRKTGNRWIKSQTAIGKVNRKFYSNETGEIASEFFAMPAYFPVHFSQLATKGMLALKLEYKRNSYVPETEFMIASSKTPLAQLGIGINTVYAPCSTSSNYVVEACKQLNFGNFSGLLETRYNNNKKEFTAFLTMSYTIPVKNGGKLR
jgi:hypothetical protein